MLNRTTLLTLFIFVLMPSICLAADVKGTYVGRMRLKDFAEAIFETIPQDTFQMTLKIKRISQGYHTDDGRGVAFDLLKSERHTFKGKVVTTYVDSVGANCQTVIMASLTTKPSKVTSVKMAFVNVETCSDGAFAAHIYQGTLKKGRLVSAPSATTLRRG